MRKVRVGVLMGGKSIEREVSFNSGRTVCDHLDTFNYDVVPLYQTQKGNLFILPLRFLHRGKTTDSEHRLESQAEAIAWDDLKQLVDIIYIAQHGRFAEDGTMQGLLEVLGIPYVGSKILASALGMDKSMQKKILTAAGISVPNGILVRADDIQNGTSETEILAQLKAASLSFPLVVKPQHEGSSFGVTVVKEANELIPALKKAAFCGNQPAQSVLIEEKINGMEFTTIIITERDGSLQPLSVTEIVPHPILSYFDYEQKYMPGKSIQFTPARCSDEAKKAIQEACCAVMHALGFKNLARIDGILSDDGKVVIIDPNSFSGAAPSSFMFKQAAEKNMSHTKLINHLIETELRAYGKAAYAINEQEKVLDMQKNNKIKVAVLLGGASNEKEISLESGRNVVYKLSPQKYQAIPIFVSSQLELFIIDQKLLVSSSTLEIEKQLEHAQKISWATLADYADFVFIGLHGGAGENGAVQATLEMLEIPYNGSSVLTSALCMDKWKTNSFLRSQRFDVPAGILIEKNAWETNRTESIKGIQNVSAYPLIVKPHDDGCSVMVQKVNDDKELAAAIETIFANGKEHAFVEEMVKGMELTVGVIGNKEPSALPPSQAVATSAVLSIEEKFLPGAGENQTPAPLPASALKLVQTNIENVYRALECKGYARIDCFYQSASQSTKGSERVVILEVNTLPGLTPATCIFHQAAEIGMKPMDFIDKIIEFGMEAHRERFGMLSQNKGKEDLYQQ